MFEAARDAGKINASYKVMFENQKKSENMERKEIYTYISI